MKQGMKYFITIGIIVGVAAFFALSHAHIQAAANPFDLTGTWNCCGAGGAAGQVFIITSGSGSLAGRAQLPGGRIFAAITGSVNGDSVKIITTYNDFAPGYVAPFIGKISADGNTMSGTWTSNQNQSGTWTATRSGAAPQTQPTPPPNPSQDPESIAKVIQIREFASGKPAKLEYYRGGKWYTAYESIDLRVGDKLRTDENTLAAIDFVIGGRVGMNKNSEIEIVDEGTAKQVGKPKTMSVIVRQGGIWARVTSRSQPLEIQTNGGVIGIKG